MPPRGRLRNNTLSLRARRRRAGRETWFAARARLAARPIAHASSQKQSHGSPRAAAYCLGAQPELLNLAAA